MNTLIRKGNKYRKNSDGAGEEEYIWMDQSVNKWGRGKKTPQFPEEFCQLEMCEMILLGE